MLSLSSLDGSVSLERLYLWTLLSVLALKLRGTDCWKALNVGEQIGLGSERNEGSNQGSMMCLRGDISSFLKESFHLTLSSACLDSWRNVSIVSQR